MYAPKQHSSQMYETKTDRAERRIDKSTNTVGNFNPSVTN